MVEGCLHLNGAEGHSPLQVATAVVKATTCPNYENCCLVDRGAYQILNDAEGLIPGDLGIFEGWLKLPHFALKQLVMEGNLKMFSKSYIQEAAALAVSVKSKLARSRLLHFK